MSNTKNKVEEEINSVYTKFICQTRSERLGKHVTPKTRTQAPKARKRDQAKEKKGEDRGRLEKGSMKSINDSLIRGFVEKIVTTDMG